MLNLLKKRKIVTQLESLEYDIKLAEKSQDKAQVAVLMADFSRLSRELINFS